MCQAFPLSIGAGSRLEVYCSARCPRNMSVVDNPCACFHSRRGGDRNLCVVEDTRDDLVAEIVRALAIRNKNHVATDAASLELKLCLGRSRH
jgi:hypothetical protein